MTTTQSILKDLEQLQEYLQEFGFLEGCRRQASLLAEKITQGRLLLVFIGEFKAGKSSIINSIVGRSLLATSVLEETAAIYEISFANDKEYIETIDEGGNTTTFKDINVLDNLDTDFVKVFLTERVLPPNVILVDTPGLSSLNKQLSQRCMAYLPKADIVFFAVDANQGVTAAGRQYLQMLAQLHTKAVLLITKTDTKPGNEIVQLVRHTEQQLAGMVEKVVPYSIKTRQPALRETIDAMVMSKTDLLASGAAFQFSTIVQEAARIIEITQSNTLLSPDGLADEIQEQKDALELIAEELDLMVIRADSTFSQIETATIRKFETGLRQTEGLLMKAAIEQSDALEEIFASNLVAVSEPATAFYNSGVREYIGEVQADLTNLINKNAPQLQMPEIAIPANYQLLHQAPVLSFLRSFFNKINQRFSQMALANADDLELYEAYNVLGKLAEMMQGGTELVLRGHIRSKIEAALELARLDFAKTVHTAAGDLKQDFKETMIRKKEDIENTLVNSLEEIRRRAQNKEDNYMQWMQHMAAVKEAILSIAKNYVN